MRFHWHGGHITLTTAVDPAYRNTQNVRRFLVVQCGPDFRFNRDFIAWIRNGTPESIGDVANEWSRRQQQEAR